MGEITSEKPLPWEEEKNLKTLQNVEYESSLFLIKTCVSSLFFASEPSFSKNARAPKIRMSLGFYVKKSVKTSPEVLYVLEENVLE